jgi:hypothetical protein
MPEEVLDQPVVTDEPATPEQNAEVGNALLDKLLGPDEETSPAPDAENQPETPPKKTEKQPDPKKEAAPDPILGEEKKDKPSDEPDEEKPKNLTGRAGEAWEKKNATIRSLKEANRALEQKIQEVESRYAGYLSPEQAKDLQAQLKEAQDRIAAQESVIYTIKHERNPKYINEITTPMIALTNKAKAIAERAELDPVDVINAIADPSGTRLREIVSELSDIDRVALVNTYDKYQDVLEKKKEMDEQAVELQKKYEEEYRQEEEREIAQQRQARARDIEEKIPNIEKRFLAFAESDEEKNTLKTALEIAKQDSFWERPASIQAAAAVALAMAPFQMKKITALKDENAALKQQLSGYRASDPGAGGAQPQSTQAVVDDDENDTDIVGRIKRAATPIGSR